jgi:hypothetical protein
MVPDLLSRKPEALDLRISGLYIEDSRWVEKRVLKRLFAMTYKIREFKCIWVKAGKAPTISRTRSQSQRLPSAGPI